MLSKNYKNTKYIFDLYKIAAKMIDMDPDLYAGYEDHPEWREEDFEDKWRKADENEPEWKDINAPMAKFDPEEHLNLGGSIIGKDDAPYVENKKERHYDILPEDKDILSDDAGELDPLGEIRQDIPEIDVSPEDWEYIKYLELKDTNKVR